MRFLAIAAMLIAIAGCSKPAQPPSTNNHAEAEAGPHKGLDRSHKGDATPGVVFKNPDGGDISIAKFKGVPVVVNLWATWCAPCVKELPTLDKLAQSHDLDGALAVIAVNQEDKPHMSSAMRCCAVLVSVIAAGRGARTFVSLFIAFPTRGVPRHSFSMGPTADPRRD